MKISKPLLASLLITSIGVVSCKTHQIKKRKPKTCKAKIKPEKEKNSRKGYSCRGCGLG